MPSFRYIAKDANGTLQEGKMDVSSIHTLVRLLREKGWFAVDVTPEDLEVRAKPPPKPIFRVSGLSFRIRSIALENALKQLTILLKNGQPLAESLQMISALTQQKALSKIWTQVQSYVKKGYSLADSMKPHACFNPLLIQLIHVGEQTGKLDETIQRAVDILEKRRLLRSRLLLSLAYPFFVTLMATLSTLLMVVVILPKVEKFLLTINRKLHPITQIVVDFAHWLSFNGPFILFTLACVLGTLLIFYLLPLGRYLIDRLTLQVPVLGKALRLSGTVLFARTMATMIGSGLTVTESLMTASQLHYNRYLAEQVEFAHEYVVQGGSLSKPLSRPGAYMPLLSNMAAIGESTGKLEECLKEVADFYESQLGLLVEWVGTVSAPIIVIVIGSVIGFVYIAFFLAILGSVSIRR